MWLVVTLLVVLMSPGDATSGGAGGHDDSRESSASTATAATKTTARSGGPTREANTATHGIPVTPSMSHHGGDDHSSPPEHRKSPDVWTTASAPARDGSHEHRDDDSRERLCDDGWSELSVVRISSAKLKLSSMHCLKGTQTAKTWDEAMRYCHGLHAQLLTLDVSVFGVKVEDASEVVRKGITQGIEREIHVPGDTWTSLHITDDKQLWWDADVPLVLTKRNTSLWQWASAQPVGHSGFCGAATFSYSGPTTLQLIDCSIQKPFVCINTGLDASLVQDSSCPRGWRGNADFGQCYWSSGIQTKTFSDAKRDCEYKDATLAIPTTGPLHNLTMAAIEDNAKVWIGATISKRGVYQWINGKVVKKARVSMNSRVTSDLAQCVFVDPGLSKGGEWVGTNCNKRYSYICQKSSIKSDVKIVQNPSDLSITTTMLKQKGSNQPTMHCDAANYDPQKSVVWVHDWKYIDNGPPPGGLTLYLSSLIRQSSSQVLPVVWQGYYHCEVWGVDPVKKVASSKAYLRLNDVLTLRGTLRLPSGIYKPEYAIQNLVPDSSRVQFSQLLTELGTVRFGHFTYEPVTRIHNFTSGSLIISFAWDYSTTGNRGPRKLSSKQYERLAVRLFSKVKRDVVVHLLSTVFYSKYATFLNGIKRSDISLRRVDICPERQTLDANQHQLDWPMTTLGKTASSDQVCLSDGRPMATCQCLGDYTSGSYWGTVVFSSGCQEPEGSSLTHGLRRLAQTMTNAGNVGILSESATQLTENSDQITYPDIAYSSRVMQNMAGVRGVNHSVGRNMVKMANNILKARRSEIIQAQRVDKSSNRIVRALETYGQMADLAGAKSQRIVESEVALEVWDVTANDTILGFGSLISGNMGMDNESLVSFVKTTDMLPSKTQAAVMLSRSTVEMAIEIDNLLRDVAEPMRLTFAVFNNPTLFLSPDELNGTYKTNSKIISASFNGIRLENLSDPVVTVFQPLYRNNAYADLTLSDCVYWDFDALGGQGDWTSHGCWYNGSKDGRIICMCDHLTNFAILTDIEAADLPESHVIALNIITIIGVSLSILGLVLTILSFIVFKPLRRPRGQKVLFNLALALLAVYIVFLSGIKATSNRGACIAVAALLQYFLLVSFAWMLVEAALLYMRFVKVFNTYIEMFILKVSIPAWGVPALIVGAVAAVDYNMFRGPDDYCWLDRPAFYYGFALPVGIVIVVNAIIFVFIIKGITCDRGSGLQSTQTREELHWLQLQAAIASFVILGLTWVVGFFAVRDARLTFQYIFCILNSTQGLLIFLFHNIREKSVRAAWCSLCCRDDSSKMTFTNPVTSIASAGKRASSKRRSRNHSLVHPNDVTRTYSNPDDRKNTL